MLSENLPSKVIIIGDIWMGDIVKRSFVHSILSLYVRWVSWHWSLKAIWSVSRCVSFFMCNTHRTYHEYSTRLHKRRIATELMRSKYNNWNQIITSSPLSRWDLRGLQMSKLDKKALCNQIWTHIFSKQLASLSNRTILINNSSIRAQD
jgi:hypothetical protein